MGFDKSTQSGKNFINTEKAEIVATVDMNNVAGSPIEALEDQKAGTLTSLDTILKDITSSKEEWPEEALREVLDRFGRMSRSGWSLAHSVYCGKFNVHTSLIDFKKKAARALTSQSGKKCSIRDFKKKAVKRVKTLDTILEENTLFKVKIYIEVRKTFIEFIQEVRNVNLDEVERTRKVPNARANNLFI
jgi:tRNA uridine 5-carbamoylmethylation protein Kti12